MTRTLRLPQPFSAPLRIVPPALHSAMMTSLLNRFLASQREEGELDFLQQKTLHICIEDIGVTFSMSLRDNRLVVDNSDEFDTKISGTIYDFLLLISRSEDTDTLFFQRRLKMQGDTELGLYLKNFLDGMDVESLPYYRFGNPLLVKGVDFLKQFAPSS
jgi:predicted lipid carrier protein YhbT